MDRIELLAHFDLFTEKLITILERDTKVAVIDYDSHGTCIIKIDGYKEGFSGKGRNFLANMVYAESKGLFKEYPLLANMKFRMGHGYEGIELSTQEKYFMVLEEIFELAANSGTKEEAETKMKQVLQTAFPDIAATLAETEKRTASHPLQRFTQRVKEFIAGKNEDLPGAPSEQVVIEDLPPTPRRQHLEKYPQDFASGASHDGLQQTPGSRVKGSSRRNSR